MTRFPEADARWLISEDEGRGPTWGPRTEVIYRSGDQLIAVVVNWFTEMRRVLAR